MKLTSIFILLSFLILQPAFALTASVQRLVEFETKSNAAARRSTEAIFLPHVEIPLEMVGTDFAFRIDPRIASSLIFEVGGKKYVRWILNPEDTKWGRALLKYFKSKGLKLPVKYYFIGYQTASRSYIAEDPNNGVQFSVKSSTNITGGNWRDKKQPIGEAIDGRLLSDFLMEQNKKRPFKNFIIMDEPAILMIQGLDQAVVIRDIGPIKDSDEMIYLPGFSALFDKTGTEIALKNGSTNPYEFWTKNYIEVAGRALGELAARTGIQFDSPHSQNFLIEMDKNYKPTGRLVLRDMSDLYVDINFIKALDGDNSRILKNFNQKENILGYVAAGFGPLHGNRKPSWVNEARYASWGKVFFKNFENSFFATSGYDISLATSQRGQSGDYFNAAYLPAQNKNFKAYFDSMRANGVAPMGRGGVRCQSILLPTGTTIH
jgi:hypothetical protein